MFDVIEFDSPVVGTDNHAYLELAVTHFVSVEGDGRSWDSADDYRGYVEINWEYYTYHIEDEETGEMVCEGSGEPPMQIEATDASIEDYLIQVLLDD